MYLFIHRRCSLKWSLIRRAISFGSFKKAEKWLQWSEMASMMLLRWLYRILGLPWVRVLVLLVMCLLLCSWVVDYRKYVEFPSHFEQYFFFFGWNSCDIKNVCCCRWKITNLCSINCVLYLFPAKVTFYTESILNYIFRTGIHLFQYFRCGL